MIAHRYGDGFFDYVDATSGRSAAAFLERLRLGFAPQSVLDVGCGRGIWLAAWKAHGVEGVLGLDGAYVESAALRIDPSEFRATDLARPFDLERRFDLVQCLEVAEHLPSASADGLVASLVRHGDVVLFSAAPPGQGGEHHVNEQPPGYWVERFAAHGYAAFDCVRPAIRGVAEIEPWYRYNTLLFANEAGAARLSAAARDARVAGGAAVEELAPFAWRLRCALLRWLPRPAIELLARVRHRLERTGGPGRKRERLATLVAWLATLAVYVSGRVPLSNIDDHALPRFGVDFFGALGALVANDAAAGRARPVYWLVEGALGAVTGSGGTVLHLGRLLLLLWAVALLVRIGRRLGAPLLVSTMVALGVAWSLPAVGVWGKGGPSEAFATPLALASILLVLRSESSRGLLLAALLGLAACLSKESYAAWTAAALLAWAVRAFLASEGRVARWVAIGGAALQFAPAAWAALSVSGWSGSYLKHAVGTLNAGPRITFYAATSFAPLAVVAGFFGVVIVGMRLLRANPSGWGREDLVVLAAAIAVTVESLALGFMIDRYLLPLVIVFGLVAARACSDFEWLSTPRLLGPVLVGLVAVTLAAGAVRAALDVRLRAAEARSDERLRGIIGDALQRRGAVRIYWDPADVERAYGAIRHLAAAGVTGEIEMSSCKPFPRGSEALLGSIFAPWAKPLTRPADVIVSSRCPGVGPAPEVERGCVLELPGIWGGRGKPEMSSGGGGGGRRRR